MEVEEAAGQSHVLVGEEDKENSSTTTLVSERPTKTPRFLRSSFFESRIENVPPKVYRNLTHKVLLCMCFDIELFLLIIIVFKNRFAKIYLLSNFCRSVPFLNTMPSPKSDWAANQKQKVRRSRAVGLGWRPFSALAPSQLAITVHSVFNFSHHLCSPIYHSPEHARCSFESTIHCFLLNVRRILDQRQRKFVIW